MAILYNMRQKDLSSISVVGRFGLQPTPKSPSSLQLVPVTRIDNNVTNGGLKNWRREPAEKFCFLSVTHLEDTHEDTVGTAGTLPVCLGHNRTPGHCRHGRNTARTPSSCLGHDRCGKTVAHPGCRCAGRDADGSAGSPSG